MSQPIMHFEIPYTTHNVTQHLSTLLPTAATNLFANAYDHGNVLVRLTLGINMLNLGKSKAFLGAVFPKGNTI